MTAADSAGNSEPRKALPVDPPPGEEDLSDILLASLLSKSPPDSVPFVTRPMATVSSSNDVRDPLTASPFFADDYEP